MIKSSLRSAACGLILALAGTAGWGGSLAEAIPEPEVEALVVTGDEAAGSSVGIWPLIGLVVVGVIVASGVVGDGDSDSFLVGRE